MRWAMAANAPMSNRTRSAFGIALRTSHRASDSTTSQNNGRRIAPSHREST